jgi:hypothetical protein
MLGAGLHLLGAGLPTAPQGPICSAQVSRPRRHPDRRSPAFDQHLKASR